MNRKQFLESMGATALAAAPATSQAQEAKPLGVGLIGCGTRGSHLGQAVQQLGKLGEGSRIVAVSDIYQPRLERATARLGSPRYYKRYEELIADSEVKAVVVATPDRVHVHNALAAIRAGKDVYCEKPITHWQQFDKLKELVREVRARKAIFQMGAQRLADPIWNQAAGLVRRGEIGKPVHVQMGYFRLGDGGERGMPVEDPNATPGPSLDWEAFQADAPRKPFSIARFFQWRLFMDYSGGPSTDNNVHFIAPMMKVLGAGFPANVVALGGKYKFDGEREVPDTFDTIFQFPGGLNFTFLGTYCNDAGLETAIRGTEGTIRLEEFGLQSEPLTGSKKPRHQMARQDMTIEHMRDFVRAVETRQQPQGDIELAYRVQTALIMSMRAYLERRVVSFDAEKEEIV